MRLLLLRHTRVAGAWRPRCYGQSEAPLGAEGRAAAHRLAARIPAADALHASPSRRAALLAGLVARRHALSIHWDRRLMERDFGHWEGQPWDAIWQAEGSAMDGMIDAPGRFRPGGGETTNELAARALAWLAGLPQGASIIAVSHGGPIAALAGRLLALPVRDWFAWLPPEGSGLLIERRPAGPVRVTRWPADPAPAP
ncbi:histidine phosphatase family protein [Belnapia sp. T18]|uniref:Histidine phosphatase family protein n=1 Tax=Belnapia arida TaxID=2804533 RepID=A0ABS1U4L4_9PROT|nr:histidine phosphatase family protein [Belnapia arida]MBL6078236.1 histidine phosphatase family protein [Belnapia arida]